MVVYVSIAMWDSWWFLIKLEIIVFEKLQEAESH